MSHVMLVVIVIIACVATYLAMRGASARNVQMLRREFQDRVDGLSAKLASAEQAAAANAAAAATPKQVAQVAPAPVVAPPPKKEITPETMAVIAAAVTAYLGKKVRVRSAKLLQTPYEIINPWAQQGRVFVQASHNLRMRNH